MCSYPRPSARTHDGESTEWTDKIPVEIVTR